MIEEKQKKIIEKINNLIEVKRIKELKVKLKTNKKYNELLEELNLNIDNPKKVIELKRKLLSIEDFNEYIKLHNSLRLEFMKINSIITSIVNTHKCS